MTSLFPSQATVGYARVAVERGVDRYPNGLTYAIPAELEDLAVGERVVVPLGRGGQLTPGYVIDRVEEPPGGGSTIKVIDRRDETTARLPGQLLQLAQWISGYYCSPIGMTLATMLPAAVKRNVGMVHRTFIDLVVDPPQADPPPRISAHQRRVIEYLTDLPSADRPMERRQLMAETGLKTVGPIKRLCSAGLLTATIQESIEATWRGAAPAAHPPHQLTPQQQKIYDAIAATLQTGFSTHLVFGVTGSGKTEVYLRLIEQVIELGRAALLLVPEISLTPQTAGRLVGRFPDRTVAVLHSGLTAAQRHQQWRWVQAGRAEIVIGARSAVFAPFPDDRLGLIVVDEEHDASYKQDQVPRYQGRDVAIRRGQFADVPVVLGSATPSLESWHNATERGVYRLHQLESRVPGMALPRVYVVDFAQERRRQKDRGVHLIGPVLSGAIEHTLAAKAQLLLLLNRRGYASYLTCPDLNCGWVMGCDQCDVTMVYHRGGDLPDGGYVRCHHCLSEQRLPKLCPVCGKRVSRFGFGTQRVEEELSRKFPTLRSGETMLRVDSDTMRTARDYHQALERFGRCEVTALVGTQMIAKGLDFPGVRLVGVINADTAINLPDFRATERTFQLVSQVAGRSGRSESAGIVVVQTFNPNAAAIRLAAAHDYPQFAQRELAERHRCQLPPVCRMARIVVRDRDPDRAAAAAATLAQRLAAMLPPDVVLRGPAPCPISRIAGQFRHELELLAPTAAQLQAALAEARSASLVHAGADMAVDVDPVALM